MTATLIRGDARTLPLADESVDLICTSPPYWALRSYTDDGEHYDGQIGAEPTPAAYIDNLIDCTREWMRVLKPSGSLWLNLGDKYAGGDGSPGGPSRLQGGKKQRAVQGNGRRGTGAPAKSLIGLPWRYAIRCIDDLGLILRAEIIWSKPNGLPESVTDRVRRSHEQWFWLSRWAPETPPPAGLVRAVLEQVAAGTLTVDEGERLLDGSMTTHEAAFHLVKSQRYFSAVDAIREAYDDKTAARYATGYTRATSSSSGQTRNGVLRADCGGPAATNPLGKLPGSVWTIATEPLTVPDHLGVDHFAAYPTEWPRRIIQGWSPSGICTACGEGRRPVGSRTSEPTQGPNRVVKECTDRRDGGRPDGRPRTLVSITGEACACPDTSAPTRPAVVVDPFGGTGTTALVADALGRHGVSVDMSADYCRLAAWRTSDPGQRAKALGVPKPAAEADGQLDLLGAIA